MDRVDNPSFCSISSKRTAQQQTWICIGTDLLLQDSLLNVRSLPDYTAWKTYTIQSIHFPVLSFTTTLLRSHVKTHYTQSWSHRQQKADVFLTV